MKILLCLFFMTALAQAGEISPEFRPYLNRFVKEAEAHHVVIDKQRARSLSINFAFDLNDYNTLGQCDLNTIWIGVSESYWMTASDSEREELLFHELGHCLLGRTHEDGTMPISGGSIYKSVMNSAGNALMYRDCSKDSDFAPVCMTGSVFAPKNKNNFYNKYNKIYMDELFRSETLSPLPSKLVASQTEVTSGAACVLRVPELTGTTTLVASFYIPTAAANDCELVRKAWASGLYPGAVCLCR